MPTPPDNPVRPTPEAMRALRLARLKEEAETLRRHYENSAKKPAHSDGNPFFAWAAVRLFMRWGAGGQAESYPLPEWVAQFLGKIADRVSDFAEMVDWINAPEPPKDASDADYHAWISRMEAWRTASRDPARARDHMLQILGFSGTGMHVFQAFERAVRLQRQAEKFAHELHHVERFSPPAVRSKLMKEWVDRGLAVDEESLSGQLGEGEKLLELGRLKVKPGGRLETLEHERQIAALANRERRLQRD